MFAPILDQISKLWSRVDRMPVVRWATVVQASPLRVLLDGDEQVLPFTPASTVHGLPLGARVVCVEQHRRVTIIDAPRAGLIRRVGSASATTGDQTDITTTVTEITGTSVAFTLDTPATVLFSGSFITHSGSTSDLVQIYVRNNTTSIDEHASPANSSPVTAGTGLGQKVSGEVALPAGAHRLNIAVKRVLGSGAVTVAKRVSEPSRLMVDRIL